MGCTTNLTHKGKFLHMFKTKSGWEFASRKLTPYSQGNIDTDAVVIVPIFVRDGELEICVTKEFREPMEDFCYGFPAGLVSKNESESMCAQRELKEETGLSSTIVAHVSPQLWSSEGMTDECVCLVYIFCEGTPSREFLEPNEDIETFILNRDMCREAIDPTFDYMSDGSWGKIAYLVMQDFVNTGFSWLVEKAFGT